MLAELKLNSFHELVRSATKEEIIWMNGFLSALITNNVTETSSSIKQVTTTCSVIYATETGNSKKVAVDCSAKLKNVGVQPKLKSIDQYRATDLLKENYLLIVISTQGDGEPPAAAKKFYDYIQQNDVQLNHLQYSILALGDSAYPLFCKAGEDVDKRLHELGAQRLIPLQKCDANFENDANEWIEKLLSSALQTTSESNVIVKTKRSITQSKKIYNGKIVSHIDLNDKGSEKETYHIEISSDEEIIYEPGEAVSVVPQNKETSVIKLLGLLELNGTEILQYKNEAYKAIDLFKNKINIQYLPERVIQQYAKLIKKEIPFVRMDLVDLIRIYPFDESTNIQQLLSILEPITPRLYSISSSPSAHGENEVHLTVSKNCFTIDGHRQFGLCSDYLSSLQHNHNIKFSIQKNNSFKLPPPDADVIMIGPGTGIAPFRSFLFEREAKSAKGRNWLFFGDQYFISNFLYQTELQTFFETGLLTKLNTAFSRDQSEKIYVQHKMLQHADELFNWINNGAHIYICGTKQPMSVDVENTLIQIISEKGNLPIDAAADYLKDLQEAGRYNKDVY